MIYIFRPGKQNQYLDDRLKLLLIKFSDTVKAAYQFEPDKN